MGTGSVTNRDLPLLSVRRWCLSALSGGCTPDKAAWGSWGLVFTRLARTTPHQLAETVNVRSAERQPEPFKTR